MSRYNNMLIMIIIPTVAVLLLSLYCNNTSCAATQHRERQCQELIHT